MRRFLSILALPAVAVSVAALIPAGSGADLAADQAFDGVVNGAKHSATVTVVCAPLATLGTIKAGQTWNLAPGSHGQMGDFGGTVTASLGTASTTMTDFSSYAIPSGVAPCSGTGAAKFTPNDFGSDMKSTQVGVKFVAVAS